MVINPAIHKASWKFRRIMERVLPMKQRLPETCLMWPRGVNSKGYPEKFRLDGVEYNPLRLSWMLYNRQLWPEGMVADHICRQPRCVNPRHIRPMTDTQNLLIGLNGGVLFQTKLMGVDPARSEWPNCPLDGRLENLTRTVSELEVAQ